MPADRVLGGRQGCRLGGADGWQESDRAGWPERPHARGAGGPFGDRSWSGCPLAWNFGGREAFLESSALIE